MSAVVIPSRQRAATKAAQPAEHPLQPVWRNIASLLEAAAMTDEAHCNSGDSIRLLHRASQAAGEVAKDPAIYGDDDAIESSAFDVEALLIAALRVVGDVPSQERIELLTKAATMMVETCGQGDVLLGAIQQARPQRENVEPAPIDTKRERHHLFDGLVCQLRHAEAMARFAFNGAKGGDDLGSAPNSLLDMAAEHIEAIIANLEEKPTLHFEDQTDLLFRLCRFENLIWGAIGSIESACRIRHLDGKGDDYQESTRLEFLDELIDHAKSLRNDCDIGLWVPVFREGQNA